MDEWYAGVIPTVSYPRPTLFLPTVTLGFRQFEFGLGLASVVIMPWNIKSQTNYAVMLTRPLLSRTKPYETKIIAFKNRSRPLLSKNNKIIVNQTFILLVAQ